MISSQLRESFPEFKIYILKILFTPHFLSVEMVILYILAESYAEMFTIDALSS